MADYGTEPFGACETPKTGNSGVTLGSLQMLQGCARAAHAAQAPGLHAHGPE